MSKEKYVDEFWKEQASQEKDKLTDPSRQPASEEKDNIRKTKIGIADQVETQSKPDVQSADYDQAIEVNFLNYVTSLGFQTMIFMGEVPNPVTNTVEKNLVQAKFLIDTLSMLKEKTAGNLSSQERDLLENSVYELQLRYVQVVQQEGA